MAPRGAPILLAAVALSTVPPTAAQPTAGAILYRLTPLSNTTLAFRHCIFVASATPPSASTSLDFQFAIVAALNGDNSSISLQSTNYPAYFVALSSAAGVAPGAVGIVASPAPGDASWRLQRAQVDVLAGTATPGAASLASQSLGAFAGSLLTLARTNLAPCRYAVPCGDVVLAAAGAVDAAHQSWLLSTTPPPAAAAAVAVSTATVLNPAVNRRFLGCHADYGYVQTPRGFTANIVYGSSFESGTFASVPAWAPLARGAGADGSAAVALDASAPFNGRPSMRVSLGAGATAAARAAAVNRGLAGQGFALAAVATYEVTLWALAPPGTRLYAELRDSVANASLALAAVTTAAAAGVWTQYNTTLVPGTGTACVAIAFGSDPTVACGTPSGAAANVCLKCGGALAVGVLGGGASAHIGFVSLTPGPWGRLAAADGTPLPVLASGADALRAMGVTVLRAGGTVSQVMAWKAWRGPVPFRPSQQLVWGDSLLSGFGPFEVIEMCAALGIEPIITLAQDLNSATDFADLVEYCWGDATTVWGAQRIADGHPAVYNITVFELGNEQYNPSFVSQVAAMEARSAAVGSPPLRYCFPTNAGINAADAAAAVAAGLPIGRILADLHVGAGGAVEESAALFAAPPQLGFLQGAINLETNPSTHTMQRALEEAADLLDFFTADVAVTRRIYARTASFCSQAAAQFDAFDQGLSFFSPTGAWLQPPGHVHAMIAQTWAAVSLGTTWTAGAALPIAAQRSADGGTFVLRVVNAGAAAVALNVTLDAPLAGGTAAVMTLAATTPGADNPQSSPLAVSPVTSSAPILPGATVLQLTLPPFSFVVASAALVTPSRSAAPTASPSPSRTVSATPPLTATHSYGSSPSTTWTPSTSAAPSTSPPVTASTTPSSSSTPTASSTGGFLHVARALLISLQAVDYAGGASWPNRVSVPSGVGSFVVPAGAVPATAPLFTASLLGAPAVVFNTTSAGVAQYVTADATPAALAGLFGGAPWSFEAWVLHAGYMTFSPTESPLFQWAPRPSATCASAFVTVGDHPVWGAGGHYNCDVAYGASPAGSTVLVAGEGFMLAPYAWHFIVITYTGTVESVYVDGALTSSYPGRTLNIVQAGLMYLGAWNDGGTIQGGEVAVGALRLSTGALSAEDVAHNYAAEWPAYHAGVSLSGTPSAAPSGSAAPSATQVASLSPTPSAPTPSGTPCPSSFGWTHQLRLVSITAAADSSAFLRHACYMVWATPNYPSGNAVFTMDATMIVRRGLDGAPSSVSFQSVNYQGLFMQVQAPGSPVPPGPGGYLFFALFATVIASAAARAAASFDVVPLGGGGVALLSRQPAYAGLPITATAALGGRSCGSTVYGNATLAAPAPATGPYRWVLGDAIASSAQFTAQGVPGGGGIPYASQNVVLAPLGAPGLVATLQQPAPALGGPAALVVANASAVTWIVPSVNGTCASGAGYVACASATALVPPYAFALRPAVGCPAVCGGASFSLTLANDSAIFLVATASGAVVAARIGDAAYSPAAASFVATPATIGAASGFTITALSAEGGMLAAAPDGYVSSAPVGPGGIQLAQMWSFSWEDGSGTLAAMPTLGTAPVAGQPAACPQPTSSPTGSPAASPASTPPASATPAPTPSGTASPSASHVNTPSLTPQGTVSGSHTPAAPPSVSASPTASATASATPPIATVSLLIDLVASDYNVALGAWRNRASPGIGDFVAAPSTALPALRLFGGRPGVTFNATVVSAGGGGGALLVSSAAAFPTTSMWGGNAWTFEAWLLHWGDENGAGIAPVFQWAPRPGTVCDSAAVGLGAGAGGAASHWACDAAWAASPPMTQAVAGLGYRPSPGTWHHVCVTHTGTTFTPVLTETLYLDGVLNSARQVALAIRRGAPQLGGWTDNANATFAVGELRMHGGALSAAQVAYNYAAGAAVYGGSAPTPTVSAPPTPASTTATSSSTAAASSSPTTSAPSSSAPASYSNVGPPPSSSPTASATRAQPAASRPGTSSRTPSGSASASASGSSSTTATPPPSRSTTLSRTVAPTRTSSRTARASGSATRSVTATPSSSETASESASASPSHSASHSPSASASAGAPSGSATATRTAALPSSASGSVAPSVTAASTPPVTRSRGSTSASGSRPPSPSRTGTRSLTATKSGTRSPSGSRSGTRSQTVSRSSTHSRSTSKKAK